LDEDILGAPFPVDELSHSPTPKQFHALITCLRVAAYGLNYLVDIENAVIVDVEATPARTYDEVAATKTMIKRTTERLRLKPERLVADTAYGTGKFLGWLIGAGITPQIPVWDSRRDLVQAASATGFCAARKVWATNVKRFE
jgi:hypothetical protein